METGSYRSRDGPREMLRVVLCVVPDPESDCSVAAQADQGGKVVQNTFQTREDEKTSQGCRALFVQSETGEERFCETEINQRCICPIFHDYKCVWEIQEVSNGRVKIVLNVADRHIIRDIVRDLRDRNANVSLQSIIPSNADKGGLNQGFIDVNEITGKQAEAMEIAIKNGYYENPRKADLDAIADVLGISKSAASQRLNTAESKLVHQFVQVLDKGELRMESKDVSTWAVGD